jgi:hypothetical protein
VDAEGQWLLASGQWSAKPSGPWSVDSGQLGLLLMPADNYQLPTTSYLPTDS